MRHIYRNRALCWCFLLIGMLSLLFPGESASFELQKNVLFYHLHWGNWPVVEVHYSINPNGMPAGAIEAINAAFQTWQEVSTARISFVYDGPTTKSAGKDNTNVIVWVNSGWS